MSSGEGNDRRLHLPSVNVEQREMEVVKPLELFFDLVMVLAFTQCTALMADVGTWSGIGRGLLVLGILWWGWVGYAWLTSVIDPEEGPVRLVMFAAMAGLLVASLCVPGVFDDRAVTFVIAYGFVRLAHVALFLIASRGEEPLRRSVVTFAPTTSVSIALLAIGSQLDDTGQVIAWCAAMLIDCGGPAIAGIEGWRLVPRHFAERHNLMIILALGESIVALGAASTVDLTSGVITAAVLGVALASALWWTYFDVVSLVTENRLSSAAPGRARNSLARDSYSYLHFPMVAGIVLGAVGMHETLAHHDSHLDSPHAFALLGGVAIYLLAHVALRLRNARTLNRQRFFVALGLLAAVPLVTELDALVTLAGVNVVVWAMIAYETYRYGESRYRLRHNLPIDRR